eukprot:1041271-Prorocentrum_minimum.AAC.1
MEMFLNKQLDRHLDVSPFLGEIFVRDVMTGSEIACKGYRRIKRKQSRWVYSGRGDQSREERGHIPGGWTIRKKRGYIPGGGTNCERREGIFREGGPIARGEGIFREGGPIARGERVYSERVDGRGAVRGLGVNNTRIAKQKGGQHGRLLQDQMKWGEGVVGIFREGGPIARGERVCSGRVDQSREERGYIPGGWTGGGPVL